MSIGAPPLPLANMEEQQVQFQRDAVQVVEAARLIAAVVAASAPPQHRDPVLILREEQEEVGRRTAEAEAEADEEEAAMARWLREQQELTNAMNAMYPQASDDEDDEDDVLAPPSSSEEDSDGVSEDEGRGRSEEDDVGTPAPHSPAGIASAAANVSVTVGTSALISDSFVRGVYAMINYAYGHQRVTLADVRHRLRMGDAMRNGSANRVLHLAWRLDGRVGQLDSLVGCCSSTIDVPWCAEGCGHWGLLVVHTRAQGGGVGRALVAAAEQRLCDAGLRKVQMEYEYTVGDAHSERLRRWYEGRLGFRCDSGPPNSSEAGDTQFRRCRKRLPRRRARPGEREIDSEDTSSSGEDNHSIRSEDWATPRRPTPRIVIPPVEPGSVADEATFEAVD